MKLLNHQKRLDDLQRDLLLSECESSRTRVALEKKDFEVKKRKPYFIYLFFKYIFFSNERLINYI
jgi:hypothetical protein